MKALKYISIRLMAIVAITLAFALPANAQITPNSFFNVNWQFNAPLKTDFADKASGWGMSFEGGGYIAKNFGLGVFLNYQTNNKYIPRQTFPLNDNSTVTTDQQHSIFQLPFGATMRYRFAHYVVGQPYIGVKLGANYTKFSSDFYILEVRDKTWGFYVSPELGIDLYPFATNSIGFHLALYYSYSTNKGTVLHYNIDGINNIGFRLGVAF